MNQSKYQRSKSSDQAFFISESFTQINKSRNKSQTVAINPRQSTINKTLKKLIEFKQTLENKLSTSSNLQQSNLNLAFYLSLLENKLQGKKPIQNNISILGSQAETEDRLKRLSLLRSILQKEVETCEKAEFGLGSVKGLYQNIQQETKNLKNYAKNESDKKFDFLKNASKNSITGKRSLANKIQLTRESIGGLSYFDYSINGGSNISERTRLRHSIGLNQYENDSEQLVSTTNAETLNNEESGLEMIVENDETGMTVDQNLINRNNKNLVKVFAKRNTPNEENNVQNDKCSVIAVNGEAVIDRLKESMTQTLKTDGEQRSLFGMDENFKSNNQFDQISEYSERFINYEIIKNLQQKSPLVFDIKDRFKDEKNIEGSIIPKDDQQILTNSVIVNKKTDFVQIQQEKNKKWNFNSNNPRNGPSENNSDWQKRWESFKNKVIRLEDYKILKNENKEKTEEELKEMLLNTVHDEESLEEDNGSFNSDINESLLEELDKDIDVKAANGTVNRQSFTKIKRNYFPVKVHFQIGVNNWEDNLEKQHIIKKDRIYKDFKIQNIGWYFENGSLCGLRMTFYNPVGGIALVGRFHGIRGSQFVKTEFRENEFMERIDVANSDEGIKCINIKTNLGNEVELGISRSECSSIGLRIISRYFPRQLFLYNFFTRYNSSLKKIQNIRFLYVKTVLY